MKQASSTLAHRGQEEIISMVVFALRILGQLASNDHDASLTEVLNKKREMPFAYFLRASPQN